MSETLEEMVRNKDMKSQHSIRVAARRSGLSQHVIRVWERRYNAISPERTETNRRLFSDADIERLDLLRRATQGGESIGQIARLSNDELVQLIAPDHPGLTPTAVADSLAGDAEETPESFLETSLEAVRALDYRRLESALLRASLALGEPVLFSRLLEPLMRRLGELWHKGEVKIAHEHMASAVVRSLLGNMVSSRQADSAAPKLISTTPIKQYHELGALMATIAASWAGWQTIYLGPNMPAAEIAGAVRQIGAKAVALSIVFPDDDPKVGLELRELRRLVGAGAAILVGGQAAEAYAQIVAETDAILIRNLSDLNQALTRVRAAKLTA
jgi:DNA-binding transcriptional MerR regulator/methylmalonyl-CoA mutase cobalamin-binding subunit